MRWIGTARQARCLGAVTLLFLLTLLPVSPLAGAGPTTQQRTAFHLQDATVDGIHAAMRAGQLTCRQLVQHYLNRIEAYDRDGPALHAIQTVNPAALRDAERLDAQFQAAGLAGPLHCIPVLVKDQVQTRDMPTSYGSALFREFVPAQNATVVEKLQAAGAILLAKTTLGELAAGYAGTAFGVCQSPYYPAGNPAGSSCGSAIGVAANFGTVGIGEDTLGSIREPAARNNLVSLRPSVPLVSRFGMLPGTPSQDTLGPLARTVRDMALLLDVLAGYDPNDPVTAASVGQVPATYTRYLVPDGLRGMRLGVIREPLADDTNPEAEDYAQVWAVLDRALADMAARGATIVDPVAIPGLRDLLRRASGSYETEAALNRYLAAQPGAPVQTLRDIVLSAEVLPSARARLAGRLGLTVNDPGHLQQLLARQDLRQAVYTVLADNQLDALVYATFDHHPTPIPADILTSYLLPPQPGSNRGLASFIQFPALAVPAGFAAEGLPVGMELLGRPFAEGVLFTIAYSYEQATQHRRPPPTTPPLPGEP
jgi:amidase